MGFKKIYKALQEIFPAIDSRVLRAVALENRKDADAAVEVVLTKVIPRFSSKIGSFNSSNHSRIIMRSLKGKAPVDEIKTCLDEEQQGPYFDAECELDQQFYDANSAIHPRCGDSIVQKFEESRMPASACMSSHAVSASLLNENGSSMSPEELCGDLKCEERVEFDNSLQKYTELRVTGSYEITPSSLEKLNSGGPHHFDVDDDQSNICIEGNDLEVQNCEGHFVPSNCHSLALCSTGANSVDLMSRSEILNPDLEKEPPVLEDASREIDSSVDTENESTLGIGLTSSTQICSTLVLEDEIAVERNNKKTLFAALQSVINLMREVEVEEGVVEQAKEEAAKGGLDMLKRAEDLKEMLQHAKEANDMHAGEVNGEKAILATEVKELQSRLISLSDERDRSLGILSEMHQSLEMRLVAVKKEREAAEKERLEKEANARKILAEQELIMEKVVQEANILKEQAEENAKLRDFLVERGHVVDMLQGEISVICQDVLLLKKQFDEHLPLSKSLTSSQTSCVLASSGLTVKSAAAELVDQETDQADENTISSRDTVEVPPSGAGTIADDQNAFVDEDWEIFEA